MTPDRLTLMTLGVAAVALVVGQPASQPPLCPSIGEVVRTLPAPAVKLISPPEAMGWPVMERMQRFEAPQEERKEAAPAASAPPDEPPTTRGRHRDRPARFHRRSRHYR